MAAPTSAIDDRYEIGEVLGQGGMAVVYRARDRRLGRDVAIKMMRADLARDVACQHRFEREARSVAALNHPSIVAVYDAGTVPLASGASLPYLVMELIDGSTLRNVLLAEGPLPPARALAVAADICAALECSHAHGVVHRDIKPGNVMLARNGQVKVVDFGIAWALAGQSTRLTEPLEAIGTAWYLSPEQGRGEAGETRSDIYAVGCVLYELLCGEPPFTGENPVAVVYQHAYVPPTPPSTRNPALTADLDVLVLKALAKKRGDRYQSATQMREDLLRAADRRPLLDGDQSSSPAREPRHWSVRLLVASLVWFALTLAIFSAVIMIGGRAGPRSGAASAPSASGAPGSASLGSAASATYGSHTNAPAPSASESGHAAAGAATAASVTPTAVQQGTGSGHQPASPSPSTTRSAPRITVQPASGSPSTPFVVTGTGWPPGEVDITIDTSQGNAPVTAAADGAFRYTINAKHEFFPGDIPPGTHSVYASTPGSQSGAGASFTVNLPAR
jgi:serine/threonine protein kinase